MQAKGFIFWGLLLVVLSIIALISLSISFIGEILDGNKISQLYIVFIFYIPLILAGLLAPGVSLYKIGKSVLPPNKLQKRSLKFTITAIIIFIIGMLIFIFGNLSGYEGGILLGIIWGLSIIFHLISIFMLVASYNKSKEK